MVEITEYIDVAQVVLYVFWVFFAVLIFYLQQESRREGYPTETDDTGEYDKNMFIYMPTPKTYNLQFGQADVTVPNDVRDNRPIAGGKPNHWNGSAIVPSGDPLMDSIGPGAYAERADHVDYNAEGHAKIRPMRDLPNFKVEERDPDPRGMPITCCDKEQAGTVEDIWIDTSEFMVRYLEVKLNDGKNVLLPLGFAALRSEMGDWYVHALKSDQMQHVPGTKSDTQITLLEEEKIMAFYGGGLLYADWRRAEPLI